MIHTPVTATQSDLIVVFFSDLFVKMYFREIGYIILPCLVLFNSKKLIDPLSLQCSHSSMAFVVFNDH